MKLITRVLALTLTLSASTLWAQAEGTIPQQQPTTSAQTENPAPAQPTAIAPPEIRQAVGAVVSVSSTSLLLHSDAGSQMNFVADDKSTVPTDLKANDRVSVDYTERTDGSLHVERVSLVTAASAPSQSSAVATESPESPIANSSAILAENPPAVAATPATPPAVSDEPRPLAKSAPAKAAPRQTHANSVKAAPEVKAQPAEARPAEVPADSGLTAQSTLPQPSVTTQVPSSVALSTRRSPFHRPKGPIRPRRPRHPRPRWRRSTRSRRLVGSLRCAWPFPSYCLPEAWPSSRS